MRAIITRHHLDPSIALAPIAGRPLLARQLEWLRSEGVDEVAVEVGGSRSDDDILAFLASEPALTADVRLVPADPDAPPAVLIARAGWGDEPVLWLPGDVLAAVDAAELFAHAHGAADIYLPAPAGLCHGDLSILGATESIALVPGGWACRIRHLEDALALTAHVLAGRVAGIVVPAAPVGDGVWVARGARIERGAMIEGPVLLGPGVLVRAGARLGPGTVVEARAVIEHGARLERCLVRADVVVGEGFAAEDAIVESAVVREVRTGELVRLVDDPMLLSHRGFVRRPAVAQLSLYAMFIALALLAGWM